MEKQAMATPQPEQVRGTEGEQESTSVKGGETLGGNNDHEERVRQQEGSEGAHVPAPESEKTRQDNEAQEGNCAQEEAWRGVEEVSAALAREKMRESEVRDNMGETLFFFMPLPPRPGDAEGGPGTGGTLSSPYPDPLSAAQSGDGGWVDKGEIPTAGPGDHVLGGGKCTGRGHFSMVEIANLRRDEKEGGGERRGGILPTCPPLCTTNHGESEMRRSVSPGGRGGRRENGEERLSQAREVMRGLEKWDQTSSILLEMSTDGWRNSVQVHATVNDLFAGSFRKLQRRMIGAEVPPWALTSPEELDILGKYLPWNTERGEFRALSLPPGSIMDLDGQLRTWVDLMSTDTRLSDNLRSRFASWAMDSPWHAGKRPKQTGPSTRDHAERAAQPAVWGEVRDVTLNGHSGGTGLVVDAPDGNLAMRGLSRRGITTIPGDTVTLGLVTLGPSVTRQTGQASGPRYRRPTPDRWWSTYVTACTTVPQP